ncbi:CBN-SCP-1 protein [Caenorhabditis brenneri]|uniref:Sterol regulatory element-binding protein cleavage-activating protein n=1 Tax=Caenorhabditis brenneri TaxID=135651 RepID=G0NEA5_CAEBE|nr:CBN-SCP-1 protein [Caenorhabditis brenneri]
MNDQMRMRWKEAKERIGNAYHDYGRLCAAHPKACLSMSLLTMIVLSYPTVTRLRLPVSTPIDVFWSEHLHVNEKIAPFWINENPASYIQQFIVSTTVSPWNATEMSPEQAVRAAVASAFRIRTLLLAEPAVEELCLRLANQRDSHWPFRSKSVCVVLSPATIWYNNLQKFREDDDVIETVFNEQCKSTFCMRDLLLGAPVAATGIKQKYQTNRKRKIEYAVTIFFARYSKKVIQGLKDKLAKEFEIVETPANDERTFVQVYFHPLKTFSSYLPLISTYFVCMIYVYYSCRKIQMVASRWGLAFASCFTVASTLLMTTGICAHLDLSTTTWGSEVYPYIALIMGLENTLCITRSVVYTSPSLDVSSRIAHGLSQEGYKLTKYYILELLALLIGFLTRISDIQEFCQFSVICVTVDFYMQLFFYAPCLTFDLQRLGLEEKRKFAELLLYEEIPRLKNYAPVSCPMRKVWPKLFVMKKMQKRRLSDSGVDDRMQKESPRGDSKDDGDVPVPRPEDSVRMKIMYFTTRTRIVQRTILVVFAIWTVVLVFFVGSRQLGMENNLTNQSIESLTRSHRILSTANLQYGNWQRRTYKWWPAVAHEYNISLNSRYVTFLPPIVINAKIHPSDFMMQKIQKENQTVEQEEEDAPVLRSRIDWLEMQLKMYLAAFWLLLITTVIAFFAYVFLSDRWKVGGVKHVQEQQQGDTVGKNNGSGGTMSTKNFVETHPTTFQGHRFPIESIAIDDEDPATFVSCCQEGIVYVWNTQTGQRTLRVNRLRAAPEQGKEIPAAPKIWALAKRNDTIIIGCCDGSIEIASISRNKLIGLYTKSTIGVSHLVCRDDELAVVRLDGSLEFLTVDYDRSEGRIRVRQIELLKSIRAHQKPVCRVATWRSQLITTSFDRSIKMWNWSQNPVEIEISNVFLSHNSPVVNLAIDEPQAIMYSSCEEGVICWWNLHTGELIRTIDNNTTWAFQLATSSEYLLGFYGSSQLYLWNVENGQLACRVTDAMGDGTSEDTLYTVGSSGVVSFDDQIAATASSDSVTFWDLKHRAIIGKVKLNGKISSMRKLTAQSVLCGVDNSMYSVTVPSVRFK